MTAEVCALAALVILIVHSAFDRDRLRRRIRRLEHCVFSESSLNGKVTQLRCLCTDKVYDP